MPATPWFDGFSRRGHPDGDHPVAQNIEIEHGWLSFAFPTGDIREGDTVLLPEPAILMNVAEQVQQRPDPTNRRQ
jgi:hypothetical protein